MTTFAELAKATRERGIKAIIDLQSIAGIEETVLDAAAGWDAMSTEEREHTLNMHALLFGDKGEEAS